MNQAERETPFRDEKRASHRRALIWLMASLSLVTAGGCASPDAADHDLTLAQASRRWEDVQIASYDLSIEIACFCTAAGRWSVSVVDRQPTRALLDGVLVDTSTDQWVPTVASLFEEIQAITESSADAATVVFDGSGVPMSGTLDRRPGVDDEVTWTVIDFSPHHER